MGQQVDQQLRDAIDELLRLGKRPNVFRDARVAPGQGTEFGNEVRIGEEAHVEYEIRVFGDAMLETEADARDQDVFV